MTARIVSPWTALADPLREERDAGRSVALTNGCFDLLHVGHVRLLSEATGLADLLVVALNSDASARSLKGLGRPVMPLGERMEVVAAIADVDFVTSFDEATAEAMLSGLQPDLHVKGTDWTVETVPEGGVVRAYGGRVVIAGDPKRHSSSGLLTRLRGPA